MISFVKLHVILNISSNSTLGSAFKIADFDLRKNFTYIHIQGRRLGFQKRVPSSMLDSNFPMVSLSMVPLIGAS